MRNVYSSAKIFHFPDRLQAIAAGELPAPIHVRLKPTNRCNHRCEYCAFRNPKLYLGEQMHEQDEIPPAKMREIVADLIAMQVRAVTFSGGGEPLRYGFIAETVAQLIAGGIKVALLTNGSRLQGDVASLLARGATWVRISIDAVDRDEYARVRAVAPAEYDRVCENMRAFAARPDRTCLFGVNFIVTRENSHQVLDFLRFARDIGIDHVKVSEVVMATSAEENLRYLTSFYASVKDQLRQAAATLASDRFRIIDKLLTPNAEMESFERGYTRCPMARVLTVIAADLNVYTCQDKAYTASGLLGSIRDCRFADLWQSEPLKRRLQSLDPSRECRHHCVAHGKNLALLDYFEADPEHVDFV
ncbi:MAG: radical SAM protein [Lentisphaerae bacterium]|nr:radical SAM protein [Lentisphaerota bacterium]